MWGDGGLRSGIVRSPLGRSNGAKETDICGWTGGLHSRSRDGSLARVLAFVERLHARLLPLMRLRLRR